MSSDKVLGPSQCQSKQVNSIIDHGQHLSWEEEEEQEEVAPTFNTDALRVLAVDDSLVCLKLLVALLLKCKYSVTETTSTVEALEILRKRKHEFDIVITDLRMLEMEGLVLLQKISLEMDLPVVMLSADDKQENIMKAIKYGARHYIIKPPRMSQIKNVWQHVVQRRLFGIPNFNKGNNNNNNASSVTIEDEMSPPKAGDSKRKFLEKEGSRGIADEEAASTSDGQGSTKKKRVNWTNELHTRFVAAIEFLGPNAVPKDILRVMNVEGLTRANVASHLQKYKNALRAQAQQSTPQARNVYSNSTNPHTLQNGYQSSLSLTQASAYSMGMMTQAVNTSPYFPQGLSYQQNNLNSRILPLSNNQHLLDHKFLNPSPTMLNNAPLPSGNVLSSSPPVPRFNGLKFPSLGNNMMTNGQYGQNYAGSTQNNMFPPQLDWTTASDIKTSSFDIEPFQNTQRDTWSSSDNAKIEAHNFHSSTVHEELHIDASSFQPINTNLSDEDDNDELNSMVNSFNFEVPPSL